MLPRDAHQVVVLPQQPAHAALQQALDFAQECVAGQRCDGLMEVGRGAARLDGVISATPILQAAIDAWLPVKADTYQAGSYLFEEISREPISFVLSADAVALTDAFAEHLRAGGHADHLGADADASFVESFNRNLIAFSGFAQHIFFRNLAAVENQFGRR